MSQKSFLKKSLWDLWCLATLVGIWPRYVEPKLLSKTILNLPIPKLPHQLDGLSIVQFSDLHFSSEMSDRRLNKIVNTVDALKPDIIVFTGDFINYSKLEDAQRLKRFFCSFDAPLGCFAIVGNHDYASPVSINAAGEYDVIPSEKDDSVIRGIVRLLKPPHVAKSTTHQARSTPVHEGLKKLLEETPFKLLHNESCVIPVKDSCMNICGLGEYMIGQANPEKAFAHYDERYPGIILAHNPDTVPLLKNYPGELILSGHTHGCQINLPWVRSRITLLENPEYARGLYTVDQRWLYINRGVGSSLDFRWFAKPEITKFHLSSAP